MKPLLLSLLVIAALTAAPEKHSFTGVITDSMCARGDHSKMQMGPTDAACTKACILEHGATYVLFDGQHAYDLSDQKAPEKFAGHRVTVTGTVDAKAMSIKVDSIVPAK